MPVSRQRMPLKSATFSIFFLNQPSACGLCVCIGIEMTFIFRVSR